MNRFLEPPRLVVLGMISRDYANYAYSAAAQNGRRSCQFGQQNRGHSDFPCNPIDWNSIFAVHGLNPRSKNDADHAWDTWRTPSGQGGRLWLRDDVPKHLPKSRIFLYEYEATAVYGKDRDTFIGKANDLLESIRIERGDDETRPIILFGHSMGGLLIKQALINAHNNENYGSIKDATKGLMFFATPHNGGDWKLVSLGGMAAKIATSIGFQNGEDVLETLKTGSLFSEIMQEQWRHRLLEYNIVSFWGALDNVSNTKKTGYVTSYHICRSFLCRAQDWACQARARMLSSSTPITRECADLVIAKQIKTTRNWCDATSSTYTRRLSRKVSRIPTLRLLIRKMKVPPRSCKGGLLH